MGAWLDKLRGKFREMGGVATGNRRAEIQGKGEQLKGEAKETWEDVKHDIKQADRSDRTV